MEISKLKLKQMFSNLELSDYNLAPLTSFSYTHERFARRIIPPSTNGYGYW